MGTGFVELQKWSIIPSFAFLWRKWYCLEWLKGEYMMTESSFWVNNPFNEYCGKYCGYMPETSHPETICPYLLSWSHRRPVSSSSWIIGFVKQASCFRRKHLQHGTCKEFISGQRRCCYSGQSCLQIGEVTSLAQMPWTNQDWDTGCLLCEGAVLAQVVLIRV